MRGVVDGLTPEQRRLISYLSTMREGAWTSLVDIAHVCLLEADDDLFVPSLVALGLVDHNRGLCAVRIAPRMGHLVQKG